MVDLVRDPKVRATLSENAHRDLVASGGYAYDRFIAGVDAVLAAAGVGPLHDRERAERAVALGGRARYLRSYARGGCLRLLGTPPARRLVHTAAPLTVRVRERLNRPRRTVVDEDG